MTRTARVEPITQETQESIQVSGWRVMDVTDPNAMREVSQHDTEPQAIEAARNYERETSNEPGSQPDDTQDYESSETPRG
ncbi:hypothetical protein [Chromohalobacter israelensis]|uniref:hypothetical protein n=1 Tax=Chromohalobacter israelensis TaxID=141390 RepID=UPI000FFE4C8C|nr:hypothetical protein [Chromohalobacter salexigens]RXE47616.1 hypothetical protein B4O83_06285 [Chromohalobacter salexigens]